MLIDEDRVSNRVFGDEAGRSSCFSSASCCNFTPCAFNRRCCSRTSLKDASFRALLSQPGLTVSDRTLVEQPSPEVCSQPRYVMISAMRIALMGYCGRGVRLEWRPLLGSSDPPSVAIQSCSLRIFFRARFRAKACFSRSFSPGFR
jgi:hypothetical protein